MNLTLSLNTLYCHILICKVSLTYVQAFLSYKRLKFSRFFGFDSFPWDFRGNFFSRNALLVTINAHTKFYQNRLMGQFSMEVLTTSLLMISIFSLYCSFWCTKYKCFQFQNQFKIKINECLQNLITDTFNIKTGLVNLVNLLR